MAHAFTSSPGITSLNSESISTAGPSYEAYQILREGDRRVHAGR